MDNCMIHKANVLKKLLNSINIYYFPPYTPSFNPIEEFFGLCKFRTRKIYFENQE